MNNSLLVTYTQQLVVHEKVPRRLALSFFLEKRGLGGFNTHKRLLCESARARERAPRMSEQCHYCMFDGS